MNANSLDRHLQINRYGNFVLTDAIRPALEVPIIPREGYRIRVYRDRNASLRIPMLSAAVSAEKLFETFISLIEPLGKLVHVVLESSHGHGTDRHRDLRRNHIDSPVLISHLWDYEDLLLNDGCTGVAVLCAKKPIEVQFDEHKILHIYAPNVKPFRRILRSMGILRRKSLPLISEAEHLHHSNGHYADQFDSLAMRLGVSDSDRVFSD